MSGRGEPSAGAALEEWLLDALAVACRCERAELRADTSLADVALDSLTLVAIVTQAEVQHGVQLSADDLNEMFQAGRVADLLAVLERARTVDRATGPPSDSRRSIR